MMRFKLLCALLLKDLWNDRKISFFIVSALVAVIAPLLLLFSLKYGIVSKLQEDLLKNPHNLEIRMEGTNYQLNKAWLDKMKENPAVQFVIPLTRALNMQGDVRAANARYVADIDLIPTSYGDPLIPEHLPTLKENEVIVSMVAAERLQLNVGDEIKLFIKRKLQGNLENVAIPLNVVGILDERYFHRAGVFMTLPILLAIENYIDGYGISQFAEKPVIGKVAPHRDSFAKARIYAKDLDSVAVLAKDLREQGISTRTQANEIANIKAINSVLSTIFIIIAMTALVGTLFSLLGSFLANIERKRKEISLLSLFGLKRQELRWYLVIQTVVLSSIAFFCAVCLYSISSLVINQVISGSLPEKTFISTLLFSHYVIAFFLITMMAVIVALIGSSQLSKVQVAEVLREA